MCNKVDTSVKIFGCINAKKALTIIAIAWAILGIITIVFFVLVAFVLVKPENEGGAVATGIVGIIVGVAFSFIPFSYSIIIGILVCADCVCLYVFAAIFGILGAVGMVSDLVNKDDKNNSLGGIIIVIVFLIVDIITLYAIITLAFCGNQRAPSGIDEEEEETEDTESETAIV